MYDVKVGQRLVRSTMLQAAFSTSLLYLLANEGDIAQDFDCGFDVTTLKTYY